MPNEAATPFDLQKVVDGDTEAINRLWASYFERPVALARTMLPSHVRRVVDKEDIALSALKASARARLPADSRSWTIATIRGGCWW